MKDFKMETKCLHAGYTPAKGEPCAVPILSLIHIYADQKLSSI